MSFSCRTQTKFYTASCRSGADGAPLFFVHGLPTRSARFDAENDLYSFALTVPLVGHVLAQNRSAKIPKAAMK
jgi:hypothetical protein